VFVSSCTPCRATEDLGRLVDPHLLDRRVVEVLLQRAEAGDGVEHLAGGVPVVVDRRQDACGAALVVVREDLVDQPAHGAGVGRRVQPTTTDELADLVFDDGDRQHCASPVPIGRRRTCNPR